MQSYLRILRKTLEEGRFKGDRTGTGCYSIFGEQLRHRMADGFPLLTVKETKVRSVFRELLWFIQGGTNIHDPVFDGVMIWDQWAVKEDVVEKRHYRIDELIELAAKRKGLTVCAMRAKYSAMLAIEVSTHGHSEGAGCTRDLLIEMAGVEEGMATIYKARKGDIGPMYGRQWRDFNGVDQLKEALEILRVDPNSRRVVVSAWNPKYLPDPTKSPEENVIEGRMALAACHTMFQFCAMPLSEEERIELLFKQVPELGFTMDDLYDRHGDIRDSSAHLHVEVLRMLKTYDIPAHILHLQLYARRNGCAL